MPLGSPITARAMRPCMALLHWGDGDAPTIRTTLQCLVSVSALQGHTMQQCEMHTGVEAL